MKTYIHPNRTHSGKKNPDAPVFDLERLAPLLSRCLVVVAAGLLVSCASIDATTTEYAGARHYPPTNPASVDILRATPTQSHERIGEVVVEASTSPAPGVGEIEEKMRKEGARIGADAVVIVTDRLQPEGYYITGGYWNQTTEVYNTHKLVGVAIKYRVAPTGSPTGY